MPIGAKNASVAEIQDRKGTPFDHFLRSSRPIRGQDFRLSTNQKPRFQPDSEPPLKLNPSNSLSLCHWNVTQKIPRSIHIQSLPRQCQWNANSVPMECKLSANEVSLNCHWNATPMSLEYYLPTNRLPLDCHFSVTWLSLGCHLALSDSQVLASIEIGDRLKQFEMNQSSFNAMSMLCQCNVNAVSLRIILLIGHLPL